MPAIPRSWTVAVTAAALVAATTGCAPASAVRATAAHRASAAATCVDNVLSQLSTAQRAGQLIVSAVNAAGPTGSQLNAIATYHLGGVILTGRNSSGVSAVRAITDQVVAKSTTSAGVKPWIAADQEGGQVQALSGSGFSTIPSALSQGSVAPATLQSEATTWGGQLKQAGVNLNLAPVLDTVPEDVGRNNAPIGRYDREYGYTPQVVTDHGTAVYRGMAAAGVQTSAKHFPGLGRASGNTDTSADVTDTVTTRGDAYFQPFQAAVTGGIPLVMVSSARYTLIDNANIAAYSPTVLGTILRGALGFGGVIISDDLGNAAAVSSVPVGDRAADFIDAGGDVALTVNSSTTSAMVSGVTQRAASDSAFAAKVTAAARAVLTAKYAGGLLPCG